MVSCIKNTFLYSKNYNNLNDFNADYAVNMNYDKVYHINPRTDSKEGAIMTLPIIGAFLILCVSLFFIFYKKKDKKILEDDKEYNEGSC